MIRLFIALNVPENIKTQLIDLRNSLAGMNYKWEEKEKLHLTLKFIGDLSEEKLNDFVNELNFITTFPKLKCSIKNFGFFFWDSKPSILWAGFEIDELILHINNKLDLALEKFSIKKEIRKFNPHLTLLRIKNDPGNNFVNSFKNFTFKPINFTADSISLYKSRLLPTGSKYFEIKNYKLKELE